MASRTLSSAAQVLEHYLRLALDSGSSPVRGDMHAEIAAAFETFTEYEAETEQRIAKLEALATTIFAERV